MHSAFSMLFHFRLLYFLLNIGRKFIRETVGFLIPKVHTTDSEELLLEHFIKHQPLISERVNYCSGRRTEMSFVFLFGFFVIA